MNTVYLPAFNFSYTFFICVNVLLPTSMPAGQKKAADLITDGCKPPCCSWELNSGPLDEQEML